VPGGSGDQKWAPASASGCKAPRYQGYQGGRGPKGQDAQEQGGLDMPLGTALSPRAVCGLGRANGRGARRPSHGTILDCFRVKERCGIRSEGLGADFAQRITSLSTNNLIFNP
jgi:hypothetical protein